MVISCNSFNKESFLSKSPHWSWVSSLLCSDSSGDVSSDLFARDQSTASSTNFWTSDVYVPVSWKHKLGATSRIFDPRTIRTTVFSSKSWSKFARASVKYSRSPGEELLHSLQKNNGAREKKEAMTRAHGWFGLPFCNGHLRKLWVRRASVDKLWIPR
jgi:hypothetical protein